MTQKTRSILHILCLLLPMLLLTYSCTGTRGLAEGEKLYTGAKVNIDGEHLNSGERKQLRQEVQSKLTPQPNSSFLGMRPRVAIHNMVREPERDRGLRHWLKYRVGQAPVLIEDVDPEFNREIMVNHSENKGYFNASGSYEVEEKERTARVIYELQPRQRYFISSVSFPQDTSVLEREIAATQDKSLLKAGNPFDLDVILRERERIDAVLKQKGFYFFHADNIIIQADSTVTNQPEVELMLRVKEATPDLARHPFTIEQTIIFADYDLSEAQANRYGIPADLTGIEEHNGRYIIDPKNKFNPVIFDQAMSFHKGELYNRQDHNQTLNRLISLGVFKFVKNQFVVADSLQHDFHAYYMLTPHLFKNLRLEVLGKTNSENFVGSEVNLNWSHRNAFRGAEQFTATLFGATDWQIGGPENANNLLRLGGRLHLTVPRLWVPFANIRLGGAYIPRTQMGLGYEFQRRTQLYTLHNFTTHFGYYWKENQRKEHDLKVLDALFVRSSDVSERYMEQIQNNPNLGRVIEDQLIFGPTYSFTYTTTMLPFDNTWYYRGTADLSANITGLVTGANVRDGNQVTFFGVPFSQYAKMEHDVRFYRRLSRNTSLATRFIGGIAYPYGNSEYVPFVKQFFVGGSNSLRAFRARNLGPGSYDPRVEGRPFFYDQVGDIKLELNAEYRFGIYRFIHGALFADAGNVWLINEHEDRPGGKFEGDFLKEIAVGAGFGLRMDFSVMVLRLDLAVPLRVPYLPEGERWTFDQFDITDGHWRRNNLMLNIGIGYPF
ncbi:MAG: BamA/TamA family outer membrane protein [Weeksellaceae bacterium]|nr:BamA/TamA family outer membrane protein [Weeksellaceae bacterium]